MSSQQCRWSPKTIEDDGYLDSFPPGYRFCPSDSELVMDYLQKKVLNMPLPRNKIADVNLYAHNPEILAAQYEKCGEKEWYFFTPRDKKYPNGNRPKRSAGNGYWKATGADKEVLYENKIVGYRKALVFHIGNPPNGTKTNWIMHEFRMVGAPQPNRDTNEMRLDDWVLSRIYEKAEKTTSACATNVASTVVAPASLVNSSLASTVVSPTPLVNTVVPPAPNTHSGAFGDYESTFGNYKSTENGALWNNGPFGNHRAESNGNFMEYPLPDPGAIWNSEAENIESEAGNLGYGPFLNSEVESNEDFMEYSLPVPNPEAFQKSNEFFMTDPGFQKSTEYFMKPPPDPGFQKSTGCFLKYSYPPPPPDPRFQKSAEYFMKPPPDPEFQKSTEYFTPYNNYYHPPPPDPGFQKSDEYFMKPPPDPEFQMSMEYCMKHNYYRPPPPYPGFQKSTEKPPLDPGFQKSTECFMKYYPPPDPEAPPPPGSGSC